MSACGTRWWMATLGGALLLCGSLCAAQAVDPEEAQYNVVVTLYNAGQWESALKMINAREALSLSDGMRAKYMRARGMVLEYGKKPAEARNAYEALIQKFPHAVESAQARLSLTFMAYAAKDYPAVVAAIAALEQDKLSASDRQKVMLMNAEACLALNETRKALDLYKQALAAGADRKIVDPRLFQIYQTLQMHKEIIDLAAVAVPGVNADALQTVRTESLLALGRNAEVEAEAGKVKADSPYFARVCFSLAQALIRQNKLKNAIVPLTTAIRDLKNPVPPPSAHLALAECLLADNRPVDADQAIDAACMRANELDEKDRKSLLSQASLFQIRTATALHDNQKLIKAVDAARSSLPADKLADVLYARLFALHQQKDYAGVLRTLKDDLPAFQGKPQEGNVLLIYFTAYKQGDRLEEGRALLESFIQRKPNTAEAAKAKLELANAALTKGEFAAAQKQLQELLAMEHVASHIGADAFVEAHYNVAAVAVKLKDSASAINALSKIQGLKPDKAMIGRSMFLLGQVYAQADDWTHAVTAWQTALAQGSGVNERDLRDRLGRALVAAGRPAEAKAQFEALAKAEGGINKLTNTTREAWARALYALSDFAGAADGYQGLHQANQASALYAYECAVCMEHAEKWEDAEKWYLLAEKGRDPLPPAYAQALPLNLSRVRFKTGTGDRGFDFWIGKLTASASDADFEAALPALSKIAEQVSPGTVTLNKLEALAKQYGPDHPRSYGLGALTLQLCASGDKERLRKLSTQWAADYDRAFAAKKLPADKWCSTVAPAMIHFFKGEAERHAGNQGDALAAYETVLSAYPYNEWPDAAACGAAECYVALGDKATALAKLDEVVKSGATAGPSLKWIEIAKQRRAELAQTKGE